ncbi:restriction endonuclease subunit S [Lacticaseibacillus paracasei]|uniref:restriction endonuclease subunit S n=1 Tax=Lacticaseibacillus paracasei TaxID=1597 RepID=UPI0021C457D4|nr:restriction endonuclease subunit S [Lacticaseibacillus paracasei]MCP9380096.1 restriction endonuclease subunit S [Lacticaseibacillus paracasei]
MITEQHVPQFRFKGFSDSWEQRKFSELFQKSSEKNTNLSFSRSQVLTGATMTDSDRDINSDDDYMKTYNVIHVGDILFEGHTSKQFAFGRFVLDDYRDGIVSHVFDIYRPKAKMNLSFWKYYIHDENVMRPILVRATSNARMLNALSSSEFLKQSVFVPSENEQAKIGNLLEQIDSTIALHQRKLELLKRLKQGYLQKLFPQNGENVPELRFKGYSDAWEKRKLSEVTNLITKGTTPREKGGRGEVNFIKVENLSKNGNIFTTSKVSVSEHQGYLARSILQENDILFSIAGSLGRTAIVPKLVLPANTNQALAIIRLSTGCVEFVATYLSGEAIDRYIRRNPTVGAQPNISLTQVASLQIDWPSLHEQEVISKLFARVKDLIAATQHKINLLKKLKQGYLQRIFC